MERISVQRVLQAAVGDHEDVQVGTVVAFTSRGRCGTSKHVAGQPRSAGYGCGAAAVASLDGSTRSLFKLDVRPLGRRVSPQPRPRPLALRAPCA